MDTPLVDSAARDELVAVRGELGRGAFMLVVTPQRLEGATGLPVNPLAIF
ncbi:hypothetical protein GCM10023191_036860 [Actinoallomurus oryzae]|jgi:hypothetical protein|uniref:Uncharacterized protein n=1 Tax=Actinoallomurus oryzae TaxID=502180 RepID=A0ABP8Q1H0_9ACTN